MQDTKLTPLTPQQINQIVEHARTAPISQVYEDCLKDDSGSTLRMMRKINYYKINELEQLYYDDLSASKCPIDIEWTLLAEIEDRSLKRTALNAFVQKFGLNSTEAAQKYMYKANELMEQLADAEQARIDWIDANQDNSIHAYSHFLDVHPHSDYSSEAIRRLYVLKKEAIHQMRAKPHYFPRGEVYDYITECVFSYDELVIKETLLSKDAFNHICKYPNMADEQTWLPVSVEGIPYSKEGNTDILFIGVSGSGGKTSLMASLMTLLNQSDFLLNSTDGHDNSYAKYLADYMKSNRLPPATDQCYVQVVNTLLKVEGEYFGVSFIEFAGEQISDMAGNNMEDGFTPLSSGIRNIFKNNNRKILFLSIDPTNTKGIIVGGHTDFWVYQNDIYEMLISLLKTDSEFCNKIIGIHLVITKKDLWINEPPQNTNLKELLFRNGYEVAWENLCDLCKKYEILKKRDYVPSISAFSIGKFMIGDTYSFDDRDARQIKNLICDDLLNYYNKDSFKDKFKRFFNS